MPRYAAVASLLALMFAVETHATTLFFDDFDPAKSPSWQEETGTWTDAGGRYTATDSTVNYNSLPFSLTDFTLDVDLHDVQNGGVWLRSDFNGGLENGVMLVTGGRGGSGTGIYWHIFVNGASGAILNEVTGVFVPGITDTHLRIEVQGDTYSAFLGGSSTPVTTLTTSMYASGRVALVNNGFSQSFDNVLLVPEPGSLAFAVVALLGSFAIRRRAPHRSV